MMPLEVLATLTSFVFEKRLLLLNQDYFEDICTNVYSFLTNSIVQGVYKK